MKRRDLLRAGSMGALFGSISAPVSAVAGQTVPPSPEAALALVAGAIGELRGELREERQFTELAPIRTAQKTFLRSNGKLPDFIDVGADVWFQVYDWHVRWRHPLAEGRDTQGRLTLAVNQTQVVLRPDVQGTYVGLPYDGK